MAVKEKKKPAEPAVEQNTVAPQPETKAEKPDKKAQKAAEREAKRAEKEAKKKARSFVSKIMPWFVFLLIVGGIFSAIWFNVLNVRDQYVFPALKNVPFVKTLVPDLEQAVADSEKPPKDELMTQIAQLERKLKDSEDQVAKLTQKNKLFTEQVADLQVIADQQTKFKEDKAAFDEMVASNDPAAYKAFYEQISPENAAELYKASLSSVAQSKELKNYIAKYQAMDEAAAAAVLEELLTTDSELVVTILKNIDSEKCAAVLAAMTPQNAATVTKQMYPTPPPATPTPAPTTSPAP